ncbi:hypothetical protein ACRALDRAFT_213881 [Sodiomyces alcalophilus JCM 7366]|uniref:uncharacterized protein n=1 Tax=Sodiomyces alcalophilus JCM 7366 TaxID=591952 RepID=UPI0039B60A51
MLRTWHQDYVVCDKVPGVRTLYIWFRLQRLRLVVRYRYAAYTAKILLMHAVAEPGAYKYRDSISYLFTSN